VGKVALT